MKALEAQDILEEAIALINGNRAEDYGDAHSNFQHMADLVNPIIKKADGKLSASDMALVMIQVKIARLQETPDHEDSWTDIAGYAALGAQVAITGPERPPTAPSKANGKGVIGPNDIRPESRDYSQG
tara:strand:+ start:338 stop:718 length:381 start_codon:yes stop_codon:yes gene_type:complete